MMTPDSNQTPASVAIPLIDEEIAALILLVHGPESVAFTGTRAAQSIDTAEFEIGVRGLLSKSLVSVENGDVRLSSDAASFATCLASADLTGLLVVTTDRAHDIMTFGQAGVYVAMIRSRGVGSYQATLWSSPVEDAVMAIASTLNEGDPGTDWAAGLRFQVAGSDPVDFAVGSGIYAEVLDNVPAPVEAARIRRLLEDAVDRALVP